MLSIVLSEAETCPAPFNLADYVLSGGQADAEKSALEIAGTAEIWTYGNLRQAVGEVAFALSELGLASGDKVLLRLGNTVEFPIAFLAAISAGLVAIPTSAALTKPEVEAIAALTRPALCIADEALSVPNQIRCIDPQSLHRRSSGRTLAPIPGHPDRPAYIVFTSGSAGTPRAVVHAHRAVWARRRMWDGWYDLKPDDRLLHAGAFNWTFTLGTGLLDPWARGATSLVPLSGTEPAAIGRLLVDQSSTIFASVPGVYRKILKSSPPPRSRFLRHGLAAGEKLPESLREAWRRGTDTEVYEALGMSECSTFVSASPSRPAPSGAIGYVQRGRSVAVLGDDGQPVKRGVPGTLAVHRTEPGLMLGYLREGHETPDLPLSGDWFLTGDTVRMTDDGAVAYVGRSDDMMNAGGYRVSPVEVEHAFSEAPEITECAAAEVQVKPGVKLIALFYVAAAGIVTEALDHHAERSLAGYKRPRLYIPVDELPRNKNGKLDRKALRSAYEANHGKA